MKVLLVTKNGGAEDMASLLASRGDQVRIYTPRPIEGDKVHKVSSWRPELKNADLVLFDDLSFSAYFDVMRDMKIPALGVGKGMHDIPKILPKLLFHMGVPTDPKGNLSVKMVLLLDSKGLRSVLAPHRVGRRCLRCVFERVGKPFTSLLKAAGYIGPFGIPCTSDGAVCTGDVGPAWREFAVALRREKMEALASTTLRSLVRGVPLKRSIGRQWS